MFEFLPKNVFLQDVTVDRIFRNDSVFDGKDGFNHGSSDRGKKLIGPGKSMRSKDHIIQGKDRVLWIGGFLFQDIQTSPRNLVFLQDFGQIFFG